MTTVVNVASGQVLGIVDGRDSAAVEGWLTARSQAWRNRIQIVAIDPSAAFRKAITTSLPQARIAVVTCARPRLRGVVLQPAGYPHPPRQDSAVAIHGLVGASRPGQLPGKPIAGDSWMRRPRMVCSLPRCHNPSQPGRASAV